MAMRYRYQVYVSNIGSVYRGDVEKVAIEIFRDYLRMSKEKIGRASEESVILLDGDRVKMEYTKDSEVW